MDTDFSFIDYVHQIGESAPGSIAHFLASAAALIVVAEYSLRPPLALQQRPKNAHSNLSN